MTTPQPMSYISDSYPGPPQEAPLIDLTDQKTILIMGRQNSDLTAPHSSIALLQERFRQLQRAKEMRQERELLRLYSESEQFKSTSYSPSKPFFHSELILPPRPSLQDSHCHQPDIQSKHNDLQVTNTPLLANLWSTDAVMHRTTNFDDSDVDTSLHL